MAEVPYNNGLQTVEPSLTVPNNYVDPHATPEAFGGAIATGLQKVGAGFQDAGTFFGEVAADDQFNQYQSSAYKLLYGDPTKQVKQPDGSMGPDQGFFGLRGKAAMDARPQVMAQLDQLQKDSLGNLTGPSALQFEQNSRRFRTYVTGDIYRHASDQSFKWYSSVNDATYNVSLGQIPNVAGDEEQVKHLIGDMANSLIKNQAFDGTDSTPNRLFAYQTAQRKGRAAQIERLSVDNPQQAKDVLETNKEVLGDDYYTLSKALSDRAAVGAAKQGMFDFITGGGAGGGAAAGGGGGAAPKDASTDRGVVRYIESADNYGAANGGAYQNQTGSGPTEGSKPEEQDAFYDAEAPRRRQALSVNLGRDVSLAEGYIAWQQGVTGATRLFQNPDALAINMGKNIAGNLYLPGATQEQREEVARKITSAQFIKMWTDRYAQVQKMQGGGAGAQVAATAAAPAEAPDLRVTGQPGPITIPEPADGWPSAPDMARLNLTPQEQYLYQHHLTNLKTGGAFRDNQGNISSILDITVERGGKTYVIPTVYNGRAVDSSIAVRLADNVGIDKFPSYPSEDAANARYDQMHAAMEKDTLPQRGDIPFGGDQQARIPGSAAAAAGATLSPAPEATTASAAPPQPGTGDTPSLAAQAAAASTYGQNWVPEGEAEAQNDLVNGDNPKAHAAGLLQIRQMYAARDAVRAQAEKIYKTMQTEQQAAIQANAEDPSKPAIDPITWTKMFAGHPDIVNQLVEFQKNARLAPKTPDEAKIFAAGGNEMFRRIYLPPGDPDRITSMDPIIEGLNKKQYGHTEFDYLSKEFNDIKSPGGQTLLSAKAKFFDDQKHLFVNPLHKAGDAVTGKAYLRDQAALSSYQQWATDQIRKYRSNPNHDVFDLFDQTSKDYLGSPAKLAMFMRSMHLDMNSDFADMAKEAGIAMSPPPKPDQKEFVDRRQLAEAVRLGYISWDDAEAYGIAHKMLKPRAAPKPPEATIPEDMPKGAGPRAEYVPQPPQPVPVAPFGQ